MKTALRWTLRLSVMVLAVVLGIRRLLQLANNSSRIAGFPAPTWYGAWGTPSSPPPGFQPNQTANVTIGWATISQINVNTNAPAACPSDCDTMLAASGKTKPMKKTPARFVLAIAATLVLVLICYGLARAYLYYEAARAEHMMREPGRCKARR